MRQHLLAPPVLVLLLVPLGSCGGGGGDPDALTQQGYTALASGYHDEAVRTLAAALDVMQPDAPKQLQARVGLCRALAHTDPARCVIEFDRLVRAHAEDVRIGDVETVVKELTDAKRFAEATEVLETSAAAFPDSTKIAALVKEVGDRAGDASDPDTLEALRSLGYAGDDDSRR